MSSNGIKLVCFDVGGVLVRHCRSWQEGCAAAGLPVRAGTDSPQASAVRRGITARFMAGRLGEAEFYGEMAAATGGLYSAEEIWRLHEAWLQEEYAGVAEVVTRLVEAGRVATGVLSNTNAPHWGRICGDGPECAARYPSVAALGNRHASHLMGMAKPDPEIFRAFERRVGVSGSEILYLEDLPENQAAAKAAGWRVCAIDHTIETAPQLEAVFKEHGLV
jgi:FMN phosphatase YigB (HAD superfamily)